MDGQMKQADKRVCLGEKSLCLQERHILGVENGNISLRDAWWTQRSAYCQPAVI